MLVLELGSDNDSHLFARQETSFMDSLAYDLIFNFASVLHVASQETEEDQLWSNYSSQFM